MDGELEWTVSTRHVTVAVRHAISQLARCMGHDPAVEKVELSLIQADANVAVRVLLAGRDHVEPDILSLLAFPVCGLVAEEGYGYFALRRRAQRLGALDGDLFENFRRSLTKVRARVKFFDDTDNGPEGLVDFMALVRRQSPVLFAHPSSRTLQILSGPFRPDLGVYFVDEQIVGTTHALIAALGFSSDSLLALGAGYFEKISSFAFAFSRSLGALFKRLAAILSLQDLAIDLHPVPATIAASTTHNDFVGKRFYRHVEQLFKGVSPDRIPGLMLCLGQVNAALYALPDLLGAESNLLARAQYLAAYHGTSALRTSLTDPPYWLDAGPGDILGSSRLRNVFAHYELLAAARFAVGASEPLPAAIAGIAGVSAKTVSTIARERLVRLSEFLGGPLQKASLRRLRALFGDHT